MGFGKHNITAESVVHLKIKTEQFFLAVVFCTLAISIFVTSVTTNAQPNPAESLMPSLQKAYSDLKAADYAGANMTSLALRFNTALELLERANKTNQTSSSELVSQANSLFESIPSDAQILKSAASSERQEAARVRMLVVPLEALIFALVAIGIVVVRRKVRARQFAELRLKVKG